MGRRDDADQHDDVAALAAGVLSGAELGFVAGLVQGGAGVGAHHQHHHRLAGCWGLVQAGQADRGDLAKAPVGVSVTAHPHGHDHRQHHRQGDDQTAPTLLALPPLPRRSCTADGPLHLGRHRPRPTPCTAAWAGPFTHARSSPTSPGLLSERR